MPSSSSPRTRLERIAISGLVSVFILGVMTLVVGPQYLLGTIHTLQGRLSNIKGPGTRRDTASENLAFPLIGQINPERNPPIVNVPPPVIPQTLSSASQEVIPPAPSERPSPFTDLPATHWAYPMVTELLNRELVSGFPDGSFRPEQPLTRAEFASQLARTFDLSFPREAQPFEDVNPDNWAIEEIQKSVRMGFLTGYPEEKFMPEQTIDRIQVITALTQGLNLKSSSGSRALLRYYEDYEQVPSWAIQSLTAATEAGLVVNHPDLSRLNPNRPASRAEVAATLYRALVYVGHLEDITSPHWVQPEPTAY